LAFTGSGGTQVFRASVFAKAQGPLEFCGESVVAGSVEICRQGRVAAMGEHASDLFRRTI
jgi:hypothetical protein